ncbi:MAG: type III pantothenate kinase [Gallionella sp.]|nr:type III pantothenate kinase [Gallionella sp.]
MRLLIDAGNTRIKWAFVKEAEWLESGVLPNDQVSELPQCLSRIDQVKQIWVSNVAGEAVAQYLRDLFGDVHFIASRKMQCGVQNHYANPAQLGSDRWAALIAAWHLVGKACLVVNCGTATTVDALNNKGEFMGGLILPSVQLMQQSLTRHTAQLGASLGGYTAFPVNTADAMFSGAIQATCGAIQRQHGLLKEMAAPIILSGGARDLLTSSLSEIPVKTVENLVLQGSWLIAQEASK